VRQNAFAVGLGPGLRWGSSQRSPDSLAGFEEGKGRKGMEKGYKGKEKREWKGRRGEGIRI